MVSSLCATHRVEASSPEDDAQQQRLRESLHVTRR
jgi:hypothetical protein